MILMPYLCRMAGQIFPGISAQPHGISQVEP